MGNGNARRNSGTLAKAVAIRSRSQLVGVVVGLLIASFLSATALGASSVDTPELDGLLDDVPADEIASLEGISRDFGISMEEAIRRFAWNDEFSQVASDLSEEFPLDYASARITGDTAAYIAFRGSVPESADLGLELFPASVDIEIRENVGYTAAEIERAVVQSHLEVLEQVDADVVTFFDDQTETVVFEIASSPDNVSYSQIARSAVESVASDSLDGIRVVVTESPLGSLGANESSNFHYGGEAISACTSGFGSRSSSHTSGTRGILTAAHCNNSQSDDGHSLSYQSGHEGVNGDVQWHTGPKTESDKFYQGTASSSEVTLVSVSSVANPVAGAAVCRNGKMTDQHCNTVFDAHICHNGVCSQVRTNTHTSTGGDSGGPYFWGSKAYGIHRGKMTDGAYPYMTRGVFTRALSVDDAVGVYIATN